METPEVELLRLTIRRKIDCGPADRIRSLIDYGLDWSAFAKLAINHRVTQLAHRGLLNIASDVAPEEVLAAFDVHLKASKSRNRYLARRLGAILKALESQGVPAIPFKGPLLAQDVYGNLGFRYFNDLDFLIRESDIPTTRKVLGELSFTDEYYPWHKHRAFWFSAGQNLLYSFDRRVAVEPHWALAPAHLSIDFDYRGAWGRVRWSTLENKRIRTLANEDLLAVLCVHGSKSYWRQLLWIADVAELLDSNRNLCWESILERSEHFGHLRMVLLGLFLAKDLLGSSLPPVVINEIQRHRVVTSLATRFRQSLFWNVGDSSFDIDKLARSMIQMRERGRDKIRYVVGTLTMPRPWRHTQMITLPDTLIFLYYPWKLIYDYLLIPLWVGAKFLGAKRLLQRLRKNAANGESSKGSIAEFTRSELPVTANAVRTSWAARSSAWIQWAETRRESNASLNEALFDSAGISSAHHVLDLAAGVGEPGISIAERITDGGLLFAVDVVPELVKHLRARALASGLTNVLPTIADMQALPFSSTSFDRVISTFGIMFCEDVGVALAEARRVLKPGGRAAFVVWGALAQNTLFNVLTKAVHEFVGESTTENLIPFRFSTPNSLSLEMHRAGFITVHETEIHSQTSIASNGAFWQANLEMTFAPLLQGLDSELRQLLDKDIETAFSPYRHADGYYLESCFRLTVGQRAN